MMGEELNQIILLSPRKFSDISKALIDGYLFFDFSTQYRLSHDSIAPPDQFEITDEIWSSFIDYLKR